MRESIALNLNPIKNFNYFSYLVIEIIIFRLWLILPEMQTDLSPSLTSSFYRALFYNGVLEYSANFNQPVMRAV